MIIMTKTQHRIPKESVIKAINASKGKGYKLDAEALAAIANLGYDKLSGKFTIEIPMSESDKGIFSDIITFTKEEVASFVLSYTGVAVVAAEITEIVDDGSFFRVLA